MVLTVVPDALRIAADHLRGHPDVVVLLPGLPLGRVYANRLPASPVYPLVRVQQVVDTVVVAAKAAAMSRLQVDCYAGSADGDRAARLLAVTCQAALRTLPGAVHPEGVVAAVTTVSGPSWLPDPDAGRARYVVDVGVLVHPHHT